MFTNVFTNMFTDMFTNVFTNMFTDMYTNMFTNMWTFLSKAMPSNIYYCICKSVHILYVCIIHTPEKIIMKKVEAH